MARPEKDSRRKQIEIVGRQFTVVREGLDPGEVAEFLETIAGSSEAAFRRLEQFSAFQSFAQTMGDSITEARALADHAKKQVKVEAEREKQKAREDVKRQVDVILEEARSSCVASIDETYSALLEALAEAQEIERAAFEKAKEMVTANLTTVHKGMRDTAEKHLGQVGGSFDQPTDELAESLMRAAEGTVAREPRTARGPAGVPSRDAQAGAPEPPERAPVPRPAQASVSLKESAAIDVATVRIEPREGENLCDGDVAIMVPEDAAALWVRQLRQRLLSAPGVSILEETGGDDQATVMELRLDEPVELLSMLQRMPNVRGVIKSQRTGGDPGGDGDAPGPQGQGSRRGTTLTVVLR